VRKIDKESFCVKGSRGGLDFLVERVFFSLWTRIFIPSILSMIVNKKTGLGPRRPCCIAHDFPQGIIRLNVVVTKRSDKRASSTKHPWHFGT
jgi:hypothetical protein